MTNHNDANKDSLEHLRNLPEIKKAIVSGDEQRIKALISTELFDEVQKSHLVELAKEHDQTQIAQLLNNAPAKP